jgi:GDP-D-mannose dehydratase
LFLRLEKKRQRKAHSVSPLVYTADEKIKHLWWITPKDVTKYLSILDTISYDEIYNLHAVIVDKNEENNPQCTCQKLAIELAWLFSLVSKFYFYILIYFNSFYSGFRKTNYAINKEYIEKIHEKYRQAYNDILMQYNK